MLFGASPPRHGLRDITQSPYYDSGTASGEAKKYTPMLGGGGGGDAVNTSTVSLSTRLQTPKDADQSARQRSMLKVYMANQVGCPRSHRCLCLTPRMRRPADR